MKKKIPNKELILRHAYSLFLQNGYNSVSIKDIMEISNLSKGAIYHHFRSKEDIFLETLEQYFFSALDIDPDIFKGHSFREQVKVAYMFAVDLFVKVETLEEKGVAYPIQKFYKLQLECESFPAIREKFKESSIAYRKQIQNLVEQGMASKEVQTGLDSESISYQIVGMIEGVAIHNSTIENQVGKILGGKYDRIFESYLEFICIPPKTISPIKQ
ncbi:TetR/AcrR family transcriptional regulator [Flavobacteriaceae bacterium F89]|uniref:TetR/AcrR family transcriptional regulator n=1 Tax=Cerina litoralis TaxID=2874477 RepID=A0AAE3EY89_9FLAO|nr:TetR/AcrR family transcriptional regulator [Cerina litoralis]MCG2461796.1 TetR/AcrR family transcriptional regulator [Cerina litoralis]